MACNGSLTASPTRHSLVVLGLSLILLLVTPTPGLAQGARSFQPLSEGVLARSLSLDRVEGSALEVEVLNLLVAPGGDGAAPLGLPGGAVLELLSGRGSVEAAEGVRQVGPGAIIAVNAGTPIRFDNRQGEVLMEWRATLVRRRAP
jgi:hypothetical protein